jgi:hypothetical protein
MIGKILLEVNEKRYKQARLRCSLDVCVVGTSAWRGKRHAREGGHPVTLVLTPWIPAYAGMTQPTRDRTDWPCIYEIDI